MTRLSGFLHGNQVLVEQLSDHEWRLGYPVAYIPSEGPPIVVPAGFETDFASVPRPLVWFLPRTGLWTLAAILHDWLWREDCPRGRCSWRHADRLFREAMQDLGVPLLRRWVMWSAVRLAAFGRGRHWRDWLATFPGALLIGLLVLPFIALPAVAVVASLAAWTVFEWVVYGVARLGRYTPVEPGIDFYTARRSHDTRDQPRTS